MNCPVCNVELRMADRQGIEIDFCPQCRGVWLDRGELDKIIERTNTAYGQPSPPQAESPREHQQPDPQHGQHGHYDPRYKKKKKGFLGDFFDFD